MAFSTTSHLIQCKILSLFRYSPDIDAPLCNSILCSETMHPVTNSHFAIVPFLLFALTSPILISSVRSFQTTRALSPRAGPSAVTIQRTLNFSFHILRAPEYTVPSLAMRSALHAVVADALSHFQIEALPRVYIIEPEDAAGIYFRIQQFGPVGITWGDVVQEARNLEAEISEAEWGFVEGFYGDIYTLSGELCGLIRVW